MGGALVVPPMVVGGVYRSRFVGLQREFSLFLSCLIKMHFVMQCAGLVDNQDCQQGSDGNKQKGGGDPLQDERVVS